LKTAIPVPPRIRKMGLMYRNRNRHAKKDALNHGPFFPIRDVFGAHWANAYIHEAILS
jgi:hypothetical protein